MVLETKMGIDEFQRLGGGGGGGGEKYLLFFVLLF